MMRQMTVIYLFSGLAGAILYPWLGWKRLAALWGLLSLLVPPVATASHSAEVYALLVPWFGCLGSFFICVLLIQRRQIPEWVTPLTSQWARRLLALLVFAIPAHTDYWGTAFVAGLQFMQQQKGVSVVIGMFIIGIHAWFWVELWTVMVRGDQHYRCVRDSPTESDERTATGSSGTT
jgi:hypothetical protein